MDFSKCIPSSSEYELDGFFLHKLRQLEVSLKLCFDSFDELKINSASWKAVDIHCTNNSHRYHIISFALKHGINRIGVYKNFIQLDCATYKDKKPEFVIWYG